MSRFNIRSIAWWWTVPENTKAAQSGAVAVFPLETSPGSRLRSEGTVVPYPKPLILLLDGGVGHNPYMFHNIPYANRYCSSKAKMSALSKVQMSVSSPLGDFGGCHFDERGVDEQTRTEPS